MFKTGVGAIVRASYAIYSSAVGITQFNRQTCVLWWAKNQKMLIFG